MEVEELPGNQTGLRTHTVFAHVLMKNAELYRAILEVFVRSREQFITHLRPTEVARSVDRDQEEVENALRQLRLWGNLEATQDNAEQASLEEFYRVHLLYALSLSGEAAERALAVFEETLHQPGELQTAALRDITQFLEAIRVLLESAEPDVAKLHTQLLSHAAIGSLIGRPWRSGSRKHRLRKTLTGCGVQLLDWLRRDTCKSMKKRSIDEINPARDHTRPGWRQNQFGSVRAFTLTDG